MPFTGNIYQTYDFGFGTGSSNREDLMDIIVNIAPYEAPLFSTAPKVPIKHTTHEWLEDTLTAASAQPYGGYNEGADFSAQSITQRSRKSNWTQIFRKDINVAETQRAVNPAGVSDEYQYQISLAMKEIARHIETALFTPIAGVSGASGTSRAMKNLFDFVTANTATAASGSASFNAAAINALIEKCFIAGGSPTKVYCHPNSKTQFANALGGTAVNYRNIAASDARVIANIDVYTSNFNVIELIPDRFVGSGSTSAAAMTNATGASGGRWWLLDQPHVKIGVLRPVRHVPLPPNGDSVRGMVLGEITLQVEAAAAHAVQWNVVTA